MLAALRRGACRLCQAEGAGAGTRERRRTDCGVGRREHQERAQQRCGARVLEAVQLERADELAGETEILPPQLRRLLARPADEDAIGSGAGRGGAGASLRVEGAVVESPGKGQAIEILAKAVTVLGCTRGGPVRTVGAQTYPLAKKYHTLEHLRTHAHLRPRSRVGSAVVRLRNALAFATHEFFHSGGFCTCTLR